MNIAQQDIDAGFANPDIMMAMDGNSDQNVLQEIPIYDSESARGFMDDDDNSGNFLGNV